MKVGRLFAVLLSLSALTLRLALQQERVLVQGTYTIERITETSSFNWTTGYLEAKGESAYPDYVCLPKPA